MPTAVLDASVLIAFRRGEQGAARAIPRRPIFGCFLGSSLRAHPRDGVAGPGRVADQVCFFRERQIS